MKKIPSLFVRDWDNDPSLVTEEVDLNCQWVLDGEGIPTEKFDGTACMIKDGVPYKRYDAKFDRKKGKWKKIPEGFIPCQDEPDENTGHYPGWIPVDFDKNENKWYKEAWFRDMSLEDGTFELIGPKINGNPYNLSNHQLWKHGSIKLKIYGFVFNEDLYDSLKRYLNEKDIEGIVYHHSDGRMAKIKRTDFGLEWPIKKKESRSSKLPKNQIQNKKRGEGS